jgi:uncharacterized protein (TIGR03435 family)
MSPLANHLWQSTLFAAAAGLLTLALKKNRARLRYWLWLAASLKFLVPFSLLIALAGEIHWPAPRRATPSNVLVVMDEVSQPFTAAPLPILPAPRPARSHLPEILTVLWACGFLGIASSWGIRWRRIRAAVRTASPVNIAIPIKAMSSPTQLEPGVCGIFDPVLVLPEGIFDRLTPVQLNAVVEHELCHVRHRDNLTAATHMFVETIFWFYPLVWWIGKRMVVERERACDEEVLTHGSEPRVYAEAILNVCKFYTESPLACVSGVTGSNLKERIEAIMTNRIALRLNVAKKAALAAAATVTVALPLFVGAMRAQSPAEKPKFEVASVRSCKAGEPAPGGGAKGGRGGGSESTSPDRLILPCLPLRLFIMMAYIDFADGKFNSKHDLRLEGGPGLDGDRYTINAKAEGTPGQAIMRGPMLQALLEDRFKLKIRLETREIPLYALTVAKGGLKLQPTAEGSCVPRDRTKFPMPPLEPGETPCGVGVMMSRTGGPATIFGTGATMTELSRMLGASGRPVIDKTGIEGSFDFRLKFSKDDDGEAPSIFTVLQDIGLKLEPIKGPREFLVIDHIEKPTEN